MRGWLVPREARYSFGKRDADQRVLLRTGECLTRAGHQVVTVGSQALRDRRDVPEFILSMSEDRESLRVLQRLAERGSLVLNSPESVWATCQRGPMLAALQQAAIAVPRSFLVPTLAGSGVTAPVWVKRPDYHRLREGDVSYATAAADVDSIFRRFAAAGIDTAVVQAHCPGQVVKCYVVDAEIIHVSPITQTSLLAPLRDVCVAAGQALGLHIFGVDAVIGNGPPIVIDVNDWPSFSPCCDEAASAIARLVDAYGRSGNVDERCSSA
jgi:hypothetical protein